MADALVGMRASKTGQAITQSEISTITATIGDCGSHFAALELSETFQSTDGPMTAIAHAVASQCPAMISA
jgi:hypothetical protein